MSQINSTIKGLLAARLNTLSPVLPVAWENFPLATVQGVPWLMVHQLPATQARITLGPDGWCKYPGIFQVDVLYPIGKGWKDLMATVDAICNLFLQNEGILAEQGNLKIVVLAAGPGPAMREENWYKVPVSIRYECYSNI